MVRPITRQKGRTKAKRKSFMVRLREDKGGVSIFIVRFPVAGTLGPFFRFRRRESKLVRCNRPADETQTDDIGLLPGGLQPLDDLFGRQLLVLRQKQGQRAMLRDAMQNAG